MNKKAKLRRWHKRKRFASGIAFVLCISLLFSGLSITALGMEPSSDMNPQEVATDQSIKTSTDEAIDKKDDDKEKSKDDSGEKKEDSNEDEKASEPSIKDEKADKPKEKKDKISPMAAYVEPKVNISLYTGKGGSELDQSGSGYVWDYNSRAEYMATVNIEAEPQVKDRVFVISAPKNMKFSGNLTESHEHLGVKLAYDDNQKKVIVTIEDSDPEAESIQLSLDLPIKPDWIDDNESVSAGDHESLRTKIGQDLKDSSDSSDPRPTYSVDVNFTGSHDGSSKSKTTTKKLITETYQDANIFNYFGSRPYTTYAAVNKNDKIVSNSYTLSNNVVHEPFWDAILKVYIPDGITVSGIETKSELGKTYIELKSDSGDGFNLNKMLSPSKDGTYSIFGKAINFDFVSLGALSSGDTFPIDADLEYQTHAGKQTQEFKNFWIKYVKEYTDSYRIYQNPKGGGASRSAEFDLPGGYTGLKSKEMGQWIGMQEIDSTKINNIHSGGSITISPGSLNYNISEMEIPSDLDITAEYYIDGDSSPHTATVSGTILGFPGSSITTPVTSIKITLNNGIKLYNENNSSSKTVQFYFTFDTKDVNVVEKTDMLFSLTGGSEDPCSKYEHDTMYTHSNNPQIIDGAHTFTAPVTIRPTQDDLKVETFTYHKDSQSFPFVNKDPKNTGDNNNAGRIASIGFGYKSSNNTKDDVGAFKIYKNFTLDVKSDALDMFNGTVNLGSNFYVSGACIKYTTNKNPSEQSTASVNRGAPYHNGSSGANFNIPIKFDEGEYITSLKFYADEFMPLVVGDTSTNCNNALITFNSRTDRAFPKDTNVAVEHYTDQQYPYSAEYTYSDAGSNKTAAKRTDNADVGFRKFIYGDINVQTGNGQSGAYVSKQDKGQQGSVINVDVTTQDKGNFYSYYAGEKRQLWLELNPTYKYLGYDESTLDANNITKIKENGKEYLVIGYNKGLTDGKATPSKTMKFKFLIPITTPISEKSSVFSGGWTTYGHDLADKDESVYPFVKAGITNHSRVNDFSSIEAKKNLAQGYNQTTVSMNKLETSVYSANLKGIKLIPYVESDYSQTRTATFNENQGNKIGAYVALGGDSSQDLSNYDAEFTLPTQGSIGELDFRLKGPVKNVNSGSAEGLEFTYFDGSSYLTENQVTNWASITKIKVHIDKLPKTQNIDFEMDFRTPYPSPYDLAKFNGQTAPLLVDYKATGENASGNIDNSTLAYYKLEVGDNTIAFYPNYPPNVEYTQYKLVDVKYDAKITEPAVSPTRAGHDFAGWYKSSQDATDLNQSKKFDFDNETVKQSMNLYAGWKIHTFKVTYHKNDGSGDIHKVQDGVKYGHSTTKPSDPKRTGYVFDGWYTKSKNSEQTAFNKFVFGLTKVYSNIDLYAKWSTYKYEVTFDTDGGAFSNDKTKTVKTVESPATTIDKLPTNPKRAGHEFMGWYTEKNGKGTGFTASTTVDKSQTVYANWTPKKYVLSFDVNGGSSNAPDSQTIEYAGKAKAVDSPSRQGYTFTGWNTAKSGNGTAWSADTFTMPDHNVKVYAQWRSTTTTPVTPTVPDNPDIDPNDDDTPTTTNVRPDPPAPPADDPIVTNNNNGGDEISEYADPGTPTVNIGGNDIPLYGKKDVPVWALLNLILAILGAVLAVVILIVALVRRNKDKDEEEEEYQYSQEQEEEKIKKTRKLWMVATIVLSLLSIIVFVLTENMSLPMVIVDKWTIVNAIILALEIVSSIFIFKKKKEERDDEEAIANV